VRFEGTASAIEDVGTPEVVYLCNAQIPSRSTNALQVVRMCEGFRQAGADVTLVHPFRIGNRPEGLTGDIRDFYGVSDTFDIVTLPTPLTRRLAGTRPVARPVEALPLAAYLAWRCRRNGTRFVCYSRSMLGAWIAIRMRRIFGGRGSCDGVFLELHDEPSSDSEWRLISDVDGVVVISDALRRRVVRRSDRLNGRVWVEADAVRLRRPIDRIAPAHPDALRRELEPDPAKPLVVYTGRVNAEKGAGVVLEAASHCPDVQFVLVGRVYDPAYHERAHRLGNVRLLGFVPPSRIPQYLAVADVLVLPSTASLPYAAYTSPLKLFEYMSSGRPIVASDLPVLQEILGHERNALIYAASDASALAEAVSRVAHDRSLAEQIAAQALRDVEEHTWDKRAARILAHLSAVRR
jgi:glycosyltransferase involved in cell wall biosynthesis